jgi:hypothetical protein
LKNFMPFDSWLHSDCTQSLIAHQFLPRLKELCCNFRACSFVLDWWVGTIPNRIASLIYINFD